MKCFGHALPPSSSQLLTLKTLGIIQIKQVQSFGDMALLARCVARKECAARRY